MVTGCGPYRAGAEVLLRQLVVGIQVCLVQVRAVTDRHREHVADRVVGRSLREGEENLEFSVEELSAYRRYAHWPVEAADYCEERVWRHGNARKRVDLRDSEVRQSVDGERTVTDASWAGLCFYCWVKEIWL